MTPISIAQPDVTTPDSDRMIKASAAARDGSLLAGLSIRRVQQMCAAGVFKTATKLGSGRNSHWFISASEIIRFRINNNAALQFN